MSGRCFEHPGAAKIPDAKLKTAIGLFVSGEWPVRSIASHLSVRVSALEDALRETLGEEDYEQRRIEARQNRGTVRYAGRSGSTV